ncbi:hypothetical protein JF66_08920 [Cryobacterium sp. MLB-32]|uniref:type IV toxin-antitoxin system AbiEi family antitoxin domain-containing protein n=1 Tax=Cryobacterium sp. MLB-32 TaxID=1529318 RepID=UPI0004E676DA|nr:type IV toxin-antitoxin system AbiEi family antitoxin domain-containing protein [Cryobacterium sp. MLB-32]KFF59785.1 hypothetical protein JF66_08920 [Cryobacterium sp. MLB-32]
MRPLLLLCSLGHVASTAELRLRGATATDIRGALASGMIARVSRGTYACAHVDPQQNVAAANHARIACLSALRRASVWAGLDLSLHLALPPGARGTGYTSHPRPAEGPEGQNIHYHWGLPRFDEGARSWLVSPMEAVWQAIHCLDEEHAIACLESAVHEKFLTVDEVRRICAHAPARLQRGIREMEFTADSGLETVTRRRLRHVGYRVEAQVRIGRPGSAPMPAEDLVVEDLVALEIDGAEWHGSERFHPDHDRDLQTAGLGRPTLRLTFVQIMFEWPTTLATVDRTVADARRARRRG